MNFVLSLLMFLGFGGSVYAVITAESVKDIKAFVFLAIIYLVAAILPILSAIKKKKEERE